MNIFFHEFKMHIKSVITWSFAITVIMFLFMSIFSSIAVDAKLLTESLAKFPEELLLAFGMTDLDFSSVLGFYSFFFTFCQICLAIQAANYGFSILSVEERDMTADFLMAKPVSRIKIITSKFLAAIASLTLTNVVVWIGSFITVNIYSQGKPYEAKPLILLLLSIIIFQLVFLSVGMIISLLVKRVRSVTPYSMALAFGMYVLNAFGGMLGEDKLEIITPYNHFDPNYIINNVAYDMPLVMISVTLIIISIIGSYVLYIRRNIHTAV